MSGFDDIGAYESGPERKIVRGRGKSSKNPRKISPGVERFILEQGADAMPSGATPAVIGPASHVSILILGEDGEYLAQLKQDIPSNDLYNIKMERAESLENAFSLLDTQSFDVVIIDLALRQKGPVSFLQSVAAAYPEVAIIVLSDFGDESIALDALRRGAQELLPKGRLLGDTLLKTVRYAIHRKHWEQRLVELSQYDQLTGLPNRILFQDRLQQALRDAARSNALLCMIFVDLDRFKDINETLGHAVGDLLLQVVSTRLRACVRSGDTVGRLGGDEFGVITSDIGTIAEAGYLARRIIEALNVPFECAGDKIHCTASIGITLHPIDEGDSAQLLKNGALALYRAKDTGRNRFQFYDSAMNRSVQTRKNVETQIRRALDLDQFTLHYQPNVDSRSGRVVGSEALIRWESPERGLVLPGEFIPIAEECGLIVPIGEWVLRKACAQARAWRDSGHAPSRVAVNLSPLQFRRPDFANTVISILDESGMDPQDLELEITENVVMADFKTTEFSLQALYDHGVRLVIDDFGTGYSSLTYLKRFPVYKLKIDRSFIREVNVNNEDAAIANAIIKMAHSLNLRVIGEGVETVGQMDFLQQRQCDEYQGFLFAKPLPPETFESWLVDFQPQI